MIFALFCYLLVPSSKEADIVSHEIALRKKTFIEKEKSVINIICKDLQYIFVIIVMLY